MAALVLYLLTLLMAGHSSATWCVCKTGVSDSVLQKTLDYACGNGADCNPTRPKGSCFNPNNVRAHCSYAVNSFYQKKGQAPGSCDFSGTATLTTTDPGFPGCPFPSSASGSSGSSSSSSSNSSSNSTTVTPAKSSPKGGSTTVTTFPSGNSPFTGTPTTGLLGGNITDATGTGLNPDYSSESSGFALHHDSNTFFLPLCLLLTGLCSVFTML